MEKSSIFRWGHQVAKKPTCKEKSSLLIFCLQGLFSKMAGIFRNSFLTCTWKEDAVFRRLLRQKRNHLWCLHLQGQGASWAAS